VHYSGSDQDKEHCPAAHHFLSRGELITDEVNVMKKYRIGLVGFAHMHVLDQIKPFLSMPERVEWIGASDIKPMVESEYFESSSRSMNLKLCQEQCGFTRVFEDYRDLLDLKPDLVMIDSIQTMNLSELNSSPGSITQVRESANMLMRTAKGLDIPMFIVGHVNKEGSIAGPKVLEHIVDTVLHFEGDKQMSCRILRAVKNRYGSTNEIGVFEMTDKGLNEVANPSVMLLSGRPKNVSGTCVTCTIEGSRPILAETQGLATQSGYGNARRMVTGYDYNRLSMVLAVLEKRAGYYFSNCDTYINIVGGLRVDEPAIDLSIAMALISSLKDTPIDENAVVFGEIGLAGEIRAVSNAQMRINEAVRLGFTKIILPYHNLKGVSCDDAELIGVKNIRQAFEAVGQ